MIKIVKLAYIITVVGIFVGSCDTIFPEGPDPNEILAEPIEGLSPQQLSLHISGDEEFARVFAPADGLGPIFVNTSCEGCHVGDGKGHPFSTLTRFGKYDGITWDPLTELGGPQLQHRAISQFIAEKIPAEATGVTKLLPPAVTGLGLVEALNDQTLLDLADPMDLDGDGISGVPNYVDPPDFFQPKNHHIPLNGQFMGRFGKKGAAIDLFHQTVTAYREDMGITTDFLSEDLFNVQVTSAASDNVPEPELGSAIVNDVVFYVATLKPPPRRNEDDPEVRAGEALFAQIGCSGCHVPTLVSGVSDVEALSEKAFHPYSDFLLHDMGPDLDDGYIEGSSLTSEWRTAPLWGIGLASDSQGGQLFLLHDGRATNMEDAILFHGGESATSKEAYMTLSNSEKVQIIQFLESL